MVPQLPGVDGESRKSVSLARTIIPASGRVPASGYAPGREGSENTHETRSTISLHHAALCTGRADRSAGMWFPCRSAATGDSGKRTPRHAHHHHSFASTTETGQVAHPDEGRPGAATVPGHNHTPAISAATSVPSRGGRPL